ncbi:Transcription repressor OFP7 [Linum perenne]
MRKRLSSLKLSIASFHLCRPKRSDAIHPAAAAYCLSPFNPKASDINYPSRHPAPPPTTPDETVSAIRRKIASTAFDYSRSWSDCSTESLEFAGRSNEGRINNYMNKITEAEFGDDDEQMENQKVHCVDQEPVDEYYETGSLPRFSFSTISFDESMESEEEKQQRAAEDCGGRRRKGRKRVKEEAMAVVKKSSNPKEDFKRSMMEMISEKEIYEEEELEELLRCLLSLNSRHYQGHIVEAFSEIWEEIFCGFNI